MYSSSSGPASATSSAVRHERLRRVRAAMTSQGIDTLLLSLGADLPWLIGYEAMPLERLTMLVVKADHTSNGPRPTLVIPRLEAPRVEHDTTLFDIHPWNETEDPVAIVARLAKTGSEAMRTAFDDRAWATFLIRLQRLLPLTTWSLSSAVTGPLRATKDPAEIEALIAASAAADRVAAQLHAGEIALIGRTEAEVSADISQRLIAEGHDKVNFAIVAAGENSASPHHHAGARVIRANEVVLCDFGGTMNGYCSDITRCVHTGPVPAELAEQYDALMAAQAAGVAAGTIGTPCEDVDAASRRVLADAGLAEWFVHRVGHGIGMEAHEDPYMVSGNTDLVAAGHAYSVEPGIYFPGKHGFRLEDIVIATDDGPRPLNHADHRLVVVEA